MEPQQYFLDQSTGISYAIVPESGSGTFDSLQTLVEVSSLLADQDGQYQIAHSDPAATQPRHTILAQRMAETQGAGAGARYVKTIQPTQPLPQQPVPAPVPAVASRQAAGHKHKPPAPIKTRTRGSGAAQVRPCQVCGEVAGRHSYYGGEVCPSCRAFFRRSVQSRYNDSYCCVKDGDCAITLRTRKNCQYCRYKRCLDVGMKTTWVLSEEERKKKFEGRKINRKRRRRSQEEDGDHDEESDDPAAAAEEPHLISEAETLEVTELVKISGHHDISKVNDMETSLIRDIIRMVAFKHPLPRDGQQMLRDVLSRRFRRIAKKLKDFQMIPIKDKEEILNQNIPVLVELQICTIFNPDLFWRDQVAILLGIEEVDKLDRKLKTLNVSGLDDLKIEYVHMFTSPHITQSDSFLDTVRDIGSWPQDPLEYVLLCSVLLFCPDLLQLAQNSQIQKTQTKFAVLLYKYLNKKHQNEPGVAVSRYAGGINIVSKCKQLQNLRLETLKEELT